MAVQLVKRLFTVTEYHKMAEAGILREDDRVELIEGGYCSDEPYWKLSCGLCQTPPSAVSSRECERVRS